VNVSMLLLTFLSDDEVSARRSEAICSGVAAADESDTAACDEGTSEREVSRRLRPCLLPWLRTSTQPAWAVTLTGPVPPDGAASTSRSVPPSRIRKYETVLESALTTRARALRRQQ